MAQAATLTPGVGLQPFRLGQSLPEALALARSHRNSFRLVEVKYAAPQQGQQPPDIALCFPDHGFHLLFDGRQQRLRLVEIHDPTRLQVRCGAHVFGGAAQPPTFAHICEAFGPTYPGEAGGGLYPLQYPGLAFLFALPASQQGAPQQGRQQPPGGDLPVPLATPAARILVHHGAAASLAAARRAPPPPLPAGSPYFQLVEAVAGQGVLLGDSGAQLRFGDSPQDAVSELGEPTGWRAKPARPASPLGGEGPDGAPAPPDYLLSWAPRGLDALFCGWRHRLKKLVLHANAPGHPAFGLHARCNFRVHPAGSCSLDDAAGEDAAGGSPQHSASAESEGASMRTAASEASLTATDGGGGSPARQAAPPSGLAAAHQALGAQGEAAGQAEGGEEARSGLPAAPPAAQLQQEQRGTAAGAAGGGAQGDEGGGVSGAPPLGRPPRPPTSLPIPAPAPPASKAGSKKKKKKERQRVTAAAQLLGSGVPAAAAPGDELPAAADLDTETDASWADSGPSSLSSSPGMTSFLSHIAATGGAAAGAAAAAAPPPPPGSDSSADFAGKEGRLDHGSAFDGWSSADDLVAMAGEAAAPTAPAATATCAAPEAEGRPAAAAAAHPRPPAGLRVSTAVQTAPAGEGEGGGEAAAPAPLGPDPDSPDSFVLAEPPEHWDRGSLPGEFEAVPRQRSSGTQTQARLLAGPPLGGARAPPFALRRGAHASGACVGVDDGLAGIHAVFGPGAKPALHAALGGRHPFGPTHLYAYRGAVFEVLRCGSIATVTLFEA